MNRLRLRIITEGLLVIKLQLDYTILFQMVQFLIIAFIVTKGVIKPVKGAMDRRAAKMHDLQEKAHKSIAEMQSKKAEYEAKLAEVNKELAEYRGQLTKDASNKAQAVTEQVSAEVRAEIEKANEKIQKEAKLAKAAVEQDISDLKKQIVAAVSN